MAANDFSQFHELVEQLRSKMPLKELCKREDVSYWAYTSGGQGEGLLLVNADGSLQMID